ncbi:MAG: hypothetical protein ABR587_01560 [Candidatus Binatia bacterium]
MTFSSRLALASVLVIADFVAIAIPLCALGAAYVIMARPPAFLRMVLRLYDDAPANRA